MFNAENKPECFGNIKHFSISCVCCKCLSECSRKMVRETKLFGDYDIISDLELIIPIVEIVAVCVILYWIFN